MSATNGLTARIDSALLGVREVTRRLNKHLSGTLVPVLTGSRGSRASLR